MKKVLSLLIIILMFISVISPTVCAIDASVCSADTAVGQDISHPALWGSHASPSRSSSESKSSAFDGRVVLIVVVALLGIIVSTALILLNIKYSKIRKEEEAEEDKAYRKNSAFQKADDIVRGFGKLIRDCRFIQDR